jgi:hypothetical protein
MQLVSTNKKLKKKGHLWGSAVAQDKCDVAGGMLETFGHLC